MLSLYVPLMVLVYSPYGAPGVGKNTLEGLVAKVYSHYVLTGPRSPFQLYGWVDVSSHRMFYGMLEGVFGY
jgi:hypothetical protein